MNYETQPMYHKPACSKPTQQHNAAILSLGHLPHDTLETRHEGRRYGGGTDGIIRAKAYTSKDGGRKIFFPLGVSAGVFCVNRELFVDDYTKSRRTVVQVAKGSRVVVDRRNPGPTEIPGLQGTTIEHVCFNFEDLPDVADILDS